MTGLDVEAARKVLLDSLPADTKWGAWVDGALERLTGCVTDDPPQGIDRERARWVISDTLMRVYDNGTSPNAVREAQAILDDLEATALVRPVEGGTLRRCSWDECPGLEKSIPMHEQEDGPELHDLCKSAMIAPEAVAELTRLYQQLAQERKGSPVEGVTLTPEEAQRVLEWYGTSLLRAPEDRALAARLEAAS